MEEKGGEKRTERRGRTGGDTSRPSCAHLSRNIAEQRLRGCFYRRLHCAPAISRTAQRLRLVTVRRQSVVFATPRQYPLSPVRPRYFLAVFEELRPPARYSRRVVTTRGRLRDIFARVSRRRVHALRIHTNRFATVPSSKFLSPVVRCRPLAVFQVSPNLGKHSRAFGLLVENISQCIRRALSKLEKLDTYRISKMDTRRLVSY